MASGPAPGGQSTAGDQGLKAPEGADEIEAVLADPEMANVSDEDAKALLGRAATIRGGLK